VRRGNLNWTKPQSLSLGPARPTTFEETVQQLRLSPDQYENSESLREWARRHKDKKYVPLDLLEAWGFSVNTES
jgi:hypothetical protein